MPKFKLCFLLFLFLSLYPTPYTLHPLYADTIHLQDGQELKGIVVEDYRDRLTFSTPDGEITVMKGNIRELYFDSEEDNLIKLAQLARDRRDYARSFSYYDMAYKRNPLSKVAKDGLVFLQGYLYRKEEVNKEEDVRRRAEIEKYGSSILTEKSDEEEFREAVDKLKSSIGIILSSGDGSPEISGVQTNSPASESGIRIGDRLVAIWSRLTGYMPLKDVMKALLDKPALEIKCTIERTVNVKINPNRGRLSSSNDLIGASFSMEFDGLTVSGVKIDGSASDAGLKEGDLITAIDASPTRYMPLKKAIELMRNSREESVKLTLRREVIIWRRH